MPDIFFSYKREERERVEPLVRLLEREGFEVWWDPNINPGERYRKVIDTALGSARCVVVAWSELSVDSPWVCDEAESGIIRQILVPLTLDGTPPPLGFRQFQALNLKDWSGTIDDPRVRQMMAAVRRVVDRSRLASVTAEAKHSLELSPAPPNEVEPVPQPPPAPAIEAKPAQQLSTTRPIEAKAALERPSEPAVEPGPAPPSSVATNAQSPSRPATPPSEKPKVPAAAPRLPAAKPRRLEASPPPSPVGPEKRLGKWPEEGPPRPATPAGDVQRPPVRRRWIALCVAAALIAWGGVAYFAMRETTVSPIDTTRTILSPRLVPGSPTPPVTAAAATRVVLNEEDSQQSQGKQYVGSATWRSETVKGAPLTQNMAVRADIEIPDRRVKVTLSLRRNTDVSLPASHTLEIRFLLPVDFPFGDVQNVSGVLMKSSEQAQGTSLAGLAVKVTDGYFLVGLSSVETERQRNLQLLKERSWFEIPIVYKNGRRGTLEIEKGAAGEKAFAEAFKFWLDDIFIPPNFRPLPSAGGR